LEAGGERLLRFEFIEVGNAVWRKFNAAGNLLDVALDLAAGAICR